MTTLGQALVTGRNKRGNTRFKRMSARLDEEKSRRMQTPNLRSSGPIPMLRTILDEVEDEEMDDTMVTPNRAGRGNTEVSSAVAKMMVPTAPETIDEAEDDEDEDDEEELVMQPSHINAAVEAAEKNQATIVLQ